MNEQDIVENKVELVLEWKNKDKNVYYKIDENNILTNIKWISADDVKTAEIQNDLTRNENFLIHGNPSLAFKALSEYYRTSNFSHFHGSIYSC
jgi:hypothetical protein